MIQLENQGQCFRLESGRTYFEIDRDLQPVLEKIRTSIQERLTVRHIALPVTKRVLKGCVQEPVKNAMKFVCIAGAGYICYLFSRGIVAGISVDTESNFLDLFSKDKTISLNTGLNLTNAEEAGQFIIDGLFTIYATFQLVVHKHYKESAGEIINECYKPYIIKKLSKMHKIQENINKLIIKKENINQLYQYLKKDLEYYGCDPIFYKEEEYKPATEKKEVVIDLEEKK